MLLVVVVTVAAGASAIAGQSGGLAGLAGLGALVGSFFAHDSYVGSVRFALYGIPRPAKRIELFGVTVQPVEADGWYRGYPTGTYRADVLQEVWFVKDAHRFTAWAKKQRPISARPSTAFARLQLSGAVQGASLASRVAEQKRVEWSAENIEIVSLDVAPADIAGHICARYSASVVDRRAPPGFAEQPFEVSIEGVVCPHPDAPRLEIDAGRTMRCAAGERIASAPELAAFLNGIQIRPLGHPIVTQLQLVEGSAAARPARSPFALIWAMESGSTLWTQRFRDGRWFTAHVDAQMRALATVDVDGTPFATTPTALWFAGPNGRLARVDARTDTVTLRRDIECDRTSRPAAPQDDESLGLWIGCSVAGAKSRRAGYVVKRIDPGDGTVVATLPVTDRPDQILPTSSGVWILESPVRLEDARRLHRIDGATNKIASTTELPRAWSCDLLKTSPDALLIGVKEGESAHILAIDPSSGAVRNTLALPKGISAQGVIFVDDTSAWLVVDVYEYDPRYVVAFGTHAGLLRLNRRTNQVSGPLIPTGVARELAGATATAVWLYDRGGAILRVATR